MKRFAICLLLILFVVNNSFSQNEEKPVFDSSGVLIMPKWMNEIMNNSNGVNYKKTIDRYNSYIAQLPDNGRKTPYNKAVINSFKWWRRYYMQYVCPDGIIRVPSNREVNKLLDLEEKNSSLRSFVGEKSPWQVISPFITYSAESKKKSLWQSNVSRIDASNSDPNIVYIGTDTGMVFKTTNKGQEWKACDPLRFFGGEITTIEVSNTNVNKVIVGSVMAGFFLSQDGGDTWKNISPLKSESTDLNRIRDAVFDPNDDNHIILGTDEGLWDSKDNGKTWKKKLSGMCFDIKYQITKTQQPKIYVLKNKNVYTEDGGYVNLYISDDNGESYKEKTLPVEHVASGRIAVSLSDPNYLYMIVCQSNYPNKSFFNGKPFILKSTDAGNTIIVNDISEKVEYGDRPGGQGYYDMVIDVSPNNPEHILFGLLFLYSSKDGGQTLDLYTQRYPSNTGDMKPAIGGYYGTYDLHTDMQDLDVAPDGTTWLTTDGGVVYSKDFLTSIPEVRNNGIYASELWGFDQGWNQDIIVGGRNHNANMCQDLDNYEGKTISLKGSESPSGQIFLSNERKITFHDGRLKLIMPDKWNGEFKEFENASQFLTWPYGSSKYGFNFQFDPRYAKNFLMVTTSVFADDWMNPKNQRQLWRTYDDGLSYELLKEFDSDISYYTISRSNPDKILVSTVGDIWYTTNGGKTWEKYDIPEKLKVPSSRVEINPKDENEIWVTTYDNNTEPTVFKTSDNGKTWKNESQGLSDISTFSGSKDKFFVFQLLVTGNDKDAVYAIADNKYQYDSRYQRFESKVLYRDDQTNKWVDISQGLRNGVRINRMKPFYRDGKVRISTDNGVWQRDLIDKYFTPIAQPVILNIGRADEKTPDNIYQFDSYSIVNQENAKWRWTFKPEPLEIDSYDIRNPKVKLDPEQSYDVSLTITVNINGKEVSYTKKIESMIKGPKPVGVEVIDDNDKFVEVLPTLVSESKPIKVLVKNIQDDINMYIYDINGVLVRTINVKDGDNIPTDGMQKGVHIYKISAKGYEKVGRFLIK